MSDAVLVGLFVGSYALAGVALAFALVLGRRGRVTGHVRAVVAFVVAFLVTLGFAEAVGARFELDARLKMIHLPLAISGAAALFGPLVTGYRFRAGSGTRGVHRGAVALFLVLFVAATVTGLAMLSSARPRAAGPVAPAGGRD